MSFFPNVPDVPGVPALPRDPFAEIPLLVPLVSDVLGLFIDLFAPRWGLFRDGFPVIIADSVISFDFKRNAAVATFPIEQGGFESYDKVDLPFDLHFRFSMGGLDADRSELIESVEAAFNSLDLLDAVTPEKVYTGVNIVHYDYRRLSNNGVGLLIIDTWCTQIRVNTAAAFSDTKSPNGTQTTDAGTVQTADPSSSEASSAADAS